MGEMAVQSWLEPVFLLESPDVEFSIGPAEYPGFHVEAKWDPHSRPLPLDGSAA